MIIESELSGLIPDYDCGSAPRNIERAELRIQAEDEIE